MASKFDALKKNLWKPKSLKNEIEIKKQYYESHFVSCLTCNSEGLPMDTYEWKALNNFHNNCVRTIAAASWQQQVEQGLTNENLHENTGIGTLRHYYDKTYINTFSRWLSKGESLGSLALTAYLPENNPTMTTHMVGKNDPAIARNICTFGRIANYIERFGEEEYTIYLPDPENVEQEQRMIKDTISKQELKNAFLKDLCGNPIKCTDKDVQPNTKEWSELDITTFKVAYDKYSKTISINSWDFWFKVSKEVGTKTMGDVEKYARNPNPQLSSQKPSVTIAPVIGNDIGGDSVNNSSSSSSSSSSSNDGNIGIDDNTPSTTTSKWTWKKVLKNKSLMKILTNLMKNAKNEDYAVKQSYANGNMKKYEYNEIR